MIKNIKVLPNKLSFICARFLIFSEFHSGAPIDKIKLSLLDNPFSLFKLSLLMLTKKFKYVTHHSPIGKARNISLLSENIPDLWCSIFQPTLISREPERHVGFLHWQVQLAEELGQQRIVSVVEYNKTSVDWDFCTGAIRSHSYRSRVAAQVVVFFENGYIMHP